jgi:hypothetical protein
VVLDDEPSLVHHWECPEHDDDNLWEDLCLAMRDDDPQAAFFVMRKLTADYVRITSPGPTELEFLEEDDWRGSLVNVLIEQHGLQELADLDETEDE